MNNRSEKRLICLLNYNWDVYEYEKHVCELRINMSKIWVTFVTISELRINMSEICVTFITISDSSFVAETFKNVQDRG